MKLFHVLWLVVGLTAGCGSGIRRVPGELWNFGDSITCGVGVQDYHSDTASPNSGYAYLLDVGYPGQTNYCRSGDQATDMVRNRLLPNVEDILEDRPVITMMIGTNDAYACGGSLGCRSNFEHALTAGLVLVSQPAADLMRGQDSRWGESGIWRNDDFDVAVEDGYPGKKKVRGFFRTTSQPGAARSVALSVPGGAMYLLYRAFDNGAGTMRVSIDGVPTATLAAAGAGGTSVSTQFSRALSLGAYDSVFAERLTVTPGVHTITLTSATAGRISVGALAVPAATTSRAAYLGGVLRREQGSDDAVTGAYDAIVQAEIAQMNADGYDIHFVDTRGAVNVTSDFDGGALSDGTYCPASTAPYLHPGKCGHQHLRAAFAEALRGR